MLVTLSSPHPGAPTRPSSPKVLRAKERALAPYFSIVFALNSHLSLSRSLRAHQPRSLLEDKHEELQHNG
jgi:hypothetical protein